MNGRFYDPYLQRFLSPDMIVQSQFNAQNYNRYSYCFNNPMMFTDPTGWKTETHLRDSYMIPEKGSSNNNLYVDLPGPSINENNYLYNFYGHDKTDNSKLESDQSSEVDVSDGTKKEEDKPASDGSCTNSQGDRPKVSLGEVGDQVMEPLDGFWSKTLDVITGGRTYCHFSVGWDGRITGIKPITGMAPTPGFKGGSVFIKGFGSINKQLFHTVIKKDILKSAGDFYKAVGKNPDIVVKEGLIILKGTGPYSGKVYQTGLNALDFFGF